MDPGVFGDSTTNRKCTDIFGLIIMVLFLGTVSGLTVYCIKNSDIDKLFNGYDDCGNICGKNNIKTNQTPFECFGQNMTHKKYVFIKEDEKQEGHLIKQCVENCTMNGTIIESNYCVFHKKFIPFSLVLFDYWKYVLISYVLSTSSSLVNTIICIGSFKFFKYFQIILFGMFSLYLLMFVLDTFKQAKSLFKIILIVCLVTYIVSLFYIICLCSKTMSVKSKLIKAFIQDTLEHIISFWPFVIVSLICSTLISLLLAGAIYSWIWLQTYSHLHQINTTIDYVQYPLGRTTEALLIYTFLLLCVFMKNFQNMVINGYVAKCYFTNLTNNKIIGNMFKYHLGTICCGSLLLSVTYPLRIVVNLIKGVASLTHKELVYTCSSHLLPEMILTRNGFTMTTIHGYGFCAGTIRARHLFSRNIFNVDAISNFGYFINVISSFATFCFTWAYEVSILHRFSFIDMSHKCYILCLYTVASYILIDLYCSVIEVIRNTMLLCFCEDCMWNNGTTVKPYRMSPIFAQFIENVNVYIDENKWKLVEDSWSRGPKRLY